MYWKYSQFGLMIRVLQTVRSGLPRGPRRNCIIRLRLLAMYRHGIATVVRRCESSGIGRGARAAIATTSLKSAKLLQRDSALQIRVVSRWVVFARCRGIPWSIQRWSLVRGTRELEGFVDKSVDLFEFPLLHQGADSFHHALNRRHILTVFLHLLCSSHDALDLAD